MSNQTLFPIGNFNSTGISLKLDNENKALVLYSYINDVDNAEKLTFLTSAHLSSFVKTSDLSEYLKDYVDTDTLSTELNEIKDAINNLDFSGQLTGFVTTEEFETAISGVNSKFDDYVTDTDLATASNNLQGQIDSITENLAKTVTTEAFNTAIGEVNSKFDNYATDTDLTSASNNLQGQIDSIKEDLNKTVTTEAFIKVSGDLDTAIKATDSKFANYTTTSELVNNYATRSDVTGVANTVEQVKADLTTVTNTANSNKENINKINSDISEISGKIETVEDSLSAYATKTEVNDIVSSLTGVSGTLSGLVTKDEIKDFITINDVDNKLTDYATIENVNTKVKEVEDSLSAYATKDNLAAEVKDMATDQEVADAIAAALVGTATSGFVMEQINAAIKDMATDQEVADSIREAIKDMATDAEVENLISAAVSGLVTPDNIDGFATKVDLDEVSGKVTEIFGKLSNFVSVDTFESVSIDVNSNKEKIVNIENELKTYALSSDVKTLTDELASNIGIIEDSLSAYATKTEVEDIVSSLTGVSGTLDGLATKHELQTVSGDLQASINSVDSKFAGYTNTTDLTQLTGQLNTNINTINENISKNYATKSEIKDFITIDTVETKLTDYATIEYVNPEFKKVNDSLSATNTKVDEISAAIENMATDQEVSAAIKDAVSGLATDAKVTELISAAVSSLVTPDNISGFATKTDLDIVSGDIKILSDEIKNIDYTAWEVYPTDRDLEPGEYSKTFIIEGNEETFTNPIKVDAGMTEKFAIYTNSSAEESDVIVDWGDGSTSSIKNGDYFSVKTDDNQEYIFEVAHTYEVPNQTYTVKVYGRKYWKIGHIASRGNLMSRCFTDDLPIASHLMSLGNFACRAFKLLYVNIPAYHRVLTIPTWVNCFLECKNLLKATGFKRIYPLYSLGHLFHGCWNLTDTDFRIPTTATDISYIFCNCQSLVKDVSSLFDNQANTLLGFANSTVSINYSFYGTRRITGTIPADILWNNQKTKFLGSGKCFTNSALSSQAPISWGGTASDTIIETPTNNKVNELTGKVSELETTVSEINDSLTDIDGQQHIFSMTSAELASATIVENSIYVNKDTGAVKVSDNESKLQDISYPIVDTQVLLTADEETLKKSIPNAQAILDLFSVKFVKVTNVNTGTGEVTVIDSENGEYTVRYK